MKPHRLKFNHSTRGPSNLLFFDVETRPNPVPAMRPTFRHLLRLGVAKACRMEGDKVTRAAECRFTTADEFWGFLESRLDKRRTLWVFAHNLSFDFRLVGGFKRLEGENHYKWRLTLADPPVILRGKIMECPVVFLDSLNYFRVPLAKLGDDLKLSKLPMPSFDAADEEWFTYCTRDVDILIHSIGYLRSYIYKNDLGVMGKTISQCSIHAYRHRFMREQICIHGRDDVTDLERQCYFGGQTECYRLGEIRGPVFELDVNSLYPAVMRDNEYPCNLVESRGEMSVEEARGYSEKYGGCARVWLYSSERTYPVRRWGRPQKVPGGWWRFPDDDAGDRSLRPYYARGIFRTFLCGPELRAALAGGHVEKIERASWYQTADLFSDFVNHFYRERMKFRSEGKTAWEMVAKLLLNSLYGYFAKKAPKWVTEELITPPQSWGNFTYGDTLKGYVVPGRAIAGLAQLQTGIVNLPESFVAISAFITAYGRERMRRLRTIAGEDNVYYQDTDSLFVHEQGMARLANANECHKDRLGALKVKAVADSMLIHGIKDYIFGEARILKGIGPNVPQEPDGSYLKLKFDRMHNAIAARGSEEVLVKEYKITPRHAYEKGEILHDGRILPFTLWQRDDSRCPF